MRADLALEDGSFTFPLKIKNYNDLRDPDVLVPRILVVVRVPDDVAEWTVATDNELLVRRCGYWAALRDAPATDNQKTVSVALHRANRFSRDALMEIMTRVSRGDAP